MFLLGWSLSGVTLIDDLDLLVDNLESLDSEKWSLGFPVVMWFCSGAVA